MGSNASKARQLDDLKMKLHIGASTGDIAMIKKAVDGGADINAKE